MPKKLETVNDYEPGQEYEETVVKMNKVLAMTRSNDRNMRILLSKNKKLGLTRS